MMGEKEISAPCLLTPEKNTDSFYPMYFGFSCAFVALRLLSGSDMDSAKWSETRDKMLQGSAHLLGLLVWKVQRGETNEGRSELRQKLERTESELSELKRRRSEDAKANEKVVSIFAAQEQSWLSERKKLRQQIGALLNELRVLETKKEEVISSLNGKVWEKEHLIQSRDKALQEEEGKRKELEEKLQKAEAIMEELRETVKRQNREHSSELWKHKTAFIEIVSNQRQLEAEMGRALQQVEAAKQELDLVFKEKEESISMVQKLSLEIIKLRRDLEQKDKILSALLRKSKLDTTEKQMLLKEIKISQSRKKQAELETERWRAVCGSRQELHSLTSNSADEVESLPDALLGANRTRLVKIGSSQYRRAGSQSTLKTPIVEYSEAGHRNEREAFVTKRTITATPDDSNGYSPDGDGEPMMATDVRQLEGWIYSETEKCPVVLEQRHHLEIDAFAEQMRLKDEKLEAFRWKLLSMELESKRLQSHIDGLDQNMSHLREENMKLEALLLDKESELKSLKEKFTLQLQSLHCQKNDKNSSSMDLALDHEAVCSEVKIIKRKSRQKEEESKAILLRIPQEVEAEQPPIDDQPGHISFTVQSPEGDIEVEKEVGIDPGHVPQKSVGPEEVEVVGKLSSIGNCLIKKDSSPWKMDLQALGVFYKIKRLKQQLIMLERLVGTQRSYEESEKDDQEHSQAKGFLLLMSLLNKQVSRYQSLQEKTDNLCKRMHEKDPDGSGGDSNMPITKEKTKTLEHFLEETFQLQRYMVATGQKLMEIQSRVASGLFEGAEELDGSTGFNLRRFADGVRTLFNEVQRGLEVRIARIIGDLEGTLA
ncbi:PREDICTED: golgin subfamily A member 6-like protein 22 isoform X2 [Nelumbo nucifera]|nr:PREDICTED: golgin subfamily A member 6-like protein 22 isoform X2 [Nelumbo nucifera]